MCRRIYGGVVAGLGAALLWLYGAGAPAALAQSPNLVVNPMFARELPLPGWIANHREEWIRQHAAYQATCETADVVDEIRFLNRLIYCDEYMLSLVDNPDPSNPAAPQLAADARRTKPTLRREIGMVDALIAQLRRLPACDDGKPAVPAAAPTSPAPPAPGAASLPAGTERLVIRFDHRVAALTPSGVRAFNAAVAAARAGKTVRLAIDGCDAGADFSSGSPCARWLYSLQNRLAEAGVKNPRRLFDALP